MSLNAIEMLLPILMRRLSLFSVPADLAFFVLHFAEMFVRRAAGTVAGKINVLSVYQSMIWLNLLFSDHLRLIVSFTDIFLFGKK